MTGTAAGDEHVGGPLHRNRARASSFGELAELYDASRPSYPDELVGDLFARGARSVLDIGCGTGLLGRAFLARGLDVTGVEPDERMAAVATRHGLHVEVATFEQWPARDRTFDLLVSGQAWHWVDPVPGTRKAAEVLNTGGSIALVWNHGEMDGALRASLDAVYARLAPGRATPTVVHRPSDRKERGGSEDALQSSSGFGDLEHLSYPWEREYTTAQWVSQLETHSDHHLMDREARAELLAGVASVIDERGGTFTMHYDCRATVARRG
jgi:SAM-dependent methyltransferase